jgi:hypothetical protein
MNPATWLVILVVLPIAVAIATVPALRGALGRVLRQRAFLAALVLLGVAAVGLNAATEAMRLHFRKLPVPLAVAGLADPKEGIPSRLGDWVQVSIDAPLDHSTQEVLGTKEFIFRDYVDSRVVPQEAIDKLTSLPNDQRQQRLGEIRPDAVVRLAITYYTGLVDTVPHVPEKCYVADGFEPSTAPETRTETVGVRADGTPRTVSYRHINFQDTTGTGVRADRDVAYLFHVNGHYESSNIGVRKELQNLFQTYGYFAKVELMTTGRTHTGSTDEERTAARARSIAAFNSVFAAVLPEVERCLPDWNKVVAKKK